MQSGPVRPALLHLSRTALSAAVQSRCPGVMLATSRLHHSVQAQLRSAGLAVPKAAEKRELVNALLASRPSSDATCSICCEDYGAGAPPKCCNVGAGLVLSSHCWIPRLLHFCEQPNCTVLHPGDVLRRLRCLHSFHLVCSLTSRCFRLFGLVASNAPARVLKQNSSTAGMY